MVINATKTVFNTHMLVLAADPRMGEVGQAHTYTPKKGLLYLLLYFLKYKELRLYTFTSAYYAIQRAYEASSIVVV